MKEQKLKLAIQKNGRLTQETIEFLRSSGLVFEGYRSRLFSSCRNFPLEIVYVRDDDIPDYVEKGAVDIGIVGQNVISEVRPRVRKLLNLRYGYCSLAIAVPKESDIKAVKDLKRKTVASSYPNISLKYFNSRKIDTQIIKISGSVEITPLLGIADAILDLVSTGSTLALNDLRILEKVSDSEAVLISNYNLASEPAKIKTLTKLLLRFKGVLSAKAYKYVLMNAPEKNLNRIRKIIPGLKSPTVFSSINQEWCSIQTAIKEDIFWETVEKLKILGVKGILVLPVEKLIT